MGRFHGNVGYSVTAETSPDVWKDTITVRKYYGTVLSKRSGWRDRSDSILDDFTLNLQISICADPYASEHFSDIKWVEYNGTKYKVTSAEPKRPRIILSIGGVYNENST